MKRLFIIFLCIATVFLSNSQTPQIERLQKQQQALQEEIKNTNRLYLDVRNQTTSILDRINLINKQISSRKELINAQRKEITALQQEELRLEAEIERLNKELKQKQENYANAIQGMLKHNVSRNKLFFIFSGKSLGESLRRMQYLREYSKWQKSQAEEIRKQNAEIAVRKEALVKAKSDKEKALSALQAEQQRLQSEEKTKQSEMTAARGQQRQLQKTLQEKQNQANQLYNQIEKLIAEEVARQEREAEAKRRAEEMERRRKAAEQDARTPRETESSRKTEETISSSGEKEASRTTTPAPRIEADRSKSTDETFNLSKNFAANKGKLPLPVTGTASIVGNFGAKKHNEWNVTTNSNGIDIQAQKGASIRTVFDGEVSKVFSFPGSNTCVIVRHGEYYTFYANIYDLFVKQGDKVKTGQSLGRIFTDPDTNVSAMHFQLWQKTTKLNPAPWLNRE
ncbi:MULTISPECIES: murein hydrolase activator EnvC family protein [unclassified Proteiniphilum]|jgi:septal ring factor EnvC (AmiA/AmiB activator)|uniref:murein hydrolase activator EnvC family protein n=1 Tax=unclassified Proteiniphilum TaxID=2622718 RepID=UPI00257D52A9|nr:MULTISPECIES: peptidoglycan DD-metalloendopeptidase family protein [unclassified Proteiniphilum]MDD4630719.1 peptidoglycan DD-metalloendopeptidase family protein [Proteiniphilum sp.]